MPTRKLLVNKRVRPHQNPFGSYEFSFQLDKNGHVSELEPRNALVYGRPGVELKYVSFWQKIHARDLQMFKRLLLLSQKRQKPIYFHQRYNASQHEMGWVHLRVIPLLDGRWLIRGKDISEYIWLKKRNQAERHLLCLLSERKRLPYLLDQIVRYVDHFSQQAAVSILFLSKPDGKLLPWASPSIPLSHAQEDCAVHVQSKQCLCYKAVQSGQEVVLVDLTTDPLWTSNGDSTFSAAWSLPIILRDGSILGTMTLYYSNRHHPTDKERDVMKTALALIRLATENQHEKLEKAPTESFKYLEAVRTMSQNKPTFAHFKHALTEYALETKFADRVLFWPINPLEDLPNETLRNLLALETTPHTLQLNIADQSYLCAPFTSEVHNLHWLIYERAKPMFSILEEIVATAIAERLTNLYAKTQQPEEIPLTNLTAAIAEIQQSATYDEILENTERFLKSMLHAQSVFLLSFLEPTPRYTGSIQEEQLHHLLSHLGLEKHAYHLQKDSDHQNQILTVPFKNPAVGLIGLICLSKPMFDETELALALHLVQGANQALNQTYATPPKGLAFFTINGTVHYVNEYLTQLDPNETCQQIIEQEAAQLKVGSEHFGRLSLATDQKTYEYRLTTVTNKEQVLGGLFLLQTAHNGDTDVEPLLDDLTALPNETLFMNILNVSVAHAHKNEQTLALFILDLDRFSFIYEGFGQETSQVILQEVASRIQKTLPNIPCGKLPADRFILLVSGYSSLAQLRSIADQLLDIFSTPFPAPTNSVHLTASIGIAIYADEIEDAEQLVRQANSAIKQAKRQGLGQVVLLDPGTSKKARTRLQLEAELRSGIRNKELRLYLQPVIDLGTGKVAGTEALVRWQHPIHGLLLPAHFIPLAEESDLIEQIGQWVLRETCKEMVTRFATHNDLFFSVNLSARQLQSQSLVPRVEEIIQEYGAEPHRLKLEITESVAMQDAAYTMDLLQRLHDLGVRIDLDDFGMGYSSFHYLKQFSVNSLKIDMTFISGLAEKEESRAIVKAIINVAKALHLSVTAEGIESPIQMHYLESFGCDYGQGYLFSRPKPTHELKAWLEEPHFWHH